MSTSTEEQQRIERIQEHLTARGFTMVYGSPRFENDPVYWFSVQGMDEFELEPMGAVRVGIAKGTQNNIKLFFRNASKIAMVKVHSILDDDQELLSLLD